VLSTPSARLTRTVQWEDTGEPRLPWKAKVDGELWLVRRNESPSEHPYALLVDGSVDEEFQQWPQTWKKPVDEYLKGDFGLEQERFKHQRRVGPSNLVERAPPVTKSVDDIFAEVDTENAADLAEAEREAQATGKEPFSYERLEQLLGTEPPEDEKLMRFQYYVRYSELRTLAELAEKLHELARWD